MPKPDPTNAELRDVLAGLLYYRPVPKSKNIDMPHWIGDNGPVIDPDDGLPCHPVGNSLDALAAIWAERLGEWRWLRWLWEGKWCWTAMRLGHNSSNIEDWVCDGITVPDTGDEYEDRLALTIACLEAEKGRGK